MRRGADTAQAGQQAVRRGGRRTLLSKKRSPSSGLGEGSRTKRLGAGARKSLATLYRFTRLSRPSRCPPVPGVVGIALGDVDFKYPYTAN